MLEDEHLDSGLEIRVGGDWPVMLPKQLVIDRLEKRISDGALATYSILAMLGDRSGVTRDQLAEQLGVTKRTLQRHLKALKDRGWITVTNGSDLVLSIGEAA